MPVFIYLLWLTPIAIDNSMTGCYSKLWKAWQLTLYIKIYYLERYLDCSFDHIFHIMLENLNFSTRNQIGAQTRYFNDSFHLCDWNILGNILHINAEQSWERYTLKELQLYGRVGWSPWESLRPKLYWWTVSNRQGSTHNKTNITVTGSNCGGPIFSAVRDMSFQNWSFFQKCSSPRKQPMLGQCQFCYLFYCSHKGIEPLVGR